MPYGLCTVWIAANRGTSRQQAACGLQVTVQPITVEGLLDQVEAYRRTGGIEPEPADAPRLTLVSAQLHLQEGRVADACMDLERVLSQIGAEKGKAISDAAADDLAAETTALRADLHC